ncbi:MAG TPA: HEAT repeat domain-containing protein, partial [Bdellovibrionota bacterium]|nr:HEAT repeat domain-containing protein [Bdellovibrionota bacterium]
ELEDGAAWYFSEEDADPRPVVFPYYRVNLDDYFDSRAYAKGAWVLHMLRTMLGEEAFFKGVRHYIHRRQGKLVVTADLRKDFEEATGRELGWFFEQWLGKPGYPKFAVSWTSDGAEVELVVKQMQDTSKPGGLAGTVPYFKGPVWIELGGVFRRVELSGRQKQSFRVPLAEKPAYLKFNSMSSMLAHVETVQSFDAWKAQLERSPDPVARVEAARMLGRLPEISIDIEADQLARVGVLSSCARTETEGWVRAACVDSLAAIASPAVNPQATRNVLDAIFASSSMTASESDATVRESFAALLGQFPAKRSLQALKAMALGTSGLKGPVAAVQALGGYTKDRDAYDLLVSLLPRESFQSRLRQAALETLGRLGDPRAHALGLEYARSSHVQNVRTGAFRLLAGIGRSEGGALSESSRLALEAALADTAYPIRLAAVGALGKLGNTAAIPALERVAASDPELKVRTAANEAIEAIRGAS